MRTFTEALRRDRLHIALLAFPFLLTALVWNRLPDRLPFRWYIDESATDGNSSALLFMPLVNVAVWLLLVALPYLDSRRHHYLQYPQAYSAIRLSIVLFLVVLNCAALFRAIGYNVPMATVVLYTLLFLLVVPGSKIQGLVYNHPIGIRTSWALGNPATWHAVHRFTARLWTVTASGFFIASLFVDATTRMYFVPIIVLVAAGIPPAYSYFLYRRSTGES